MCSVPDSDSCAAPAGGAVMGVDRDSRWGEAGGGCSTRSVHLGDRVDTRMLAGGGAEQKDGHAEKKIIKAVL